MWSDPIADFLTRIRNAVVMRRPEVTMPSSLMKVAIAKVLKEEGYIRDHDVVEDGKQGKLRIQLKYGPRGEQIIRSLRRESKPGSRVYRGFEELPKVLDGLGVCVVSTNLGVVSDRVCRERKVGGELLCTVY